MLCTTFRELQDANACSGRLQHLENALGGIENYGQHTPITALQILDNNGMADLCWAFSILSPRTEAKRILRLYFCFCVSSVKHLLPPSIDYDCVDVALRSVGGSATREEIDKAREKVRKTVDKMSSDKESLAARYATTMVWFALCKIGRVTPSLVYLHMTNMEIKKLSAPTRHESFMRGLLLASQ